jgi:hypothetical protein
VTPLHRFLRRLSLAAVLALPLLLGRGPALAMDGGDQIPEEPKITGVRLDRFRRLIWRPLDNYFRTPDPVRIVIEDVEPSRNITLIADDAEGTMNGDIVVKGRIRLERTEGYIEGTGLTYKALDNTGSVSDARALFGSFRVRGQELELLPKQVLQARGASFTTCSQERTHFHITAREIRVEASGRVTARNIGFHIGRTRLLNVPYFVRTFGRTVRNPIPIPTYTKQGGLQYRFTGEPVSERDLLVDFSFLLGTRLAPQGSLGVLKSLGNGKTEVALEQTRSQVAADPLRSPLETNPPLGQDPGAPAVGRTVNAFGLVNVGTHVYNRNRTDLQVSRLPEVGLTFGNLLNRGPMPSPGGNGNGAQSIQSAFGRGFLSPAEWLVNAELTAGYFDERPTRARSGRLSARADATSPLFSIARPLYVRYGGVASQAVYSGGESYTLLAPEVELDLLLTREMLVGAAYRYQHRFGRTPFLFDRLDVRHELRLVYGYSGSKWAYDLQVSYDMERVRAYDTGVSIRRRLDCMEFGLAYRARQQSLGVVLNLLPGQRPHTSATP